MHPYKELPDNSFWSRSVTRPASKDVDPVSNFDLKIDKETKVATAGSCFAQHIARYLQNSGFNYYVTEPGHPILSKEVRQKHNYGLFSARYGNIYTARQLVQLFKRAYDEFDSKEEAWVEKDGATLDPFRPTTQPGGYISINEMLADRSQHLKAVRSLFETLDVFVFTLGLTECWISNVDGSVFPICPGVSGGNFDESKYTFYNQSVTDVLADLDEFVLLLGRVNKRAKIILTVSPVPLAATAEKDVHVLSATTYSKSVLRVAADMISKRFPNVFYFPSYEIITGNYNKGQYYAKDLRSVTEAGVSHVMRLFMKHAANIDIETENEQIIKEDVDSFLAKSEEIAEVLCDEAALDEQSDENLKG